MRSHRRYTQPPLAASRPIRRPAASSSLVRRPLPSPVPSTPPPKTLLLSGGSIRCSLLPSSGPSASANAPGGFGDLLPLHAGAMSLSGDGKERKRAVHSEDQSSKADGVAEDVGDTLKGTYKHCQEEELGKIASWSCKNHFQSVKDKCSVEKSEKTRRRWSTEEDEVLIQTVNRSGQNWEIVACAIPGRNAQQCRARWKFTLDPAINKQAWSQEEELRLIRAQQTYGNKWHRMVEHFPGRTSYAIKEHWRGPLKRKLNSYLTSGLLEKFPGLPENLSVSQNSDSDILQQCDGSSDENQLLSDLRASLKSKQGLLKKFPSLPENLSVSQDSDSDILQQCDGSSDENQLLSDLRASLKSKQGLLKKFPGLPENLSVSQNSDSNILQQCDGSSDENQLLSDLRASLKSKQATSSKSNQGTSSKSKQGTSSKSKQGFIELCENTDTSEGERSEFLCKKGPDAHPVEVSERIRDRLNERKKARKILAFLSSPVELKVCAIAKSERPLQKSKQMNPEVNIISPPAVLQDFSPEVPSECEKIVEPPLVDFNHAKNVCSLEISDPCTLEQHQANILDLLDMPYCDGLMIIPPTGHPNDNDFI